jgi:hypothetical protein
VVCRTPGRYPTSKMDSRLLASMPGTQLSPPTSYVTPPGASEKSRSDTSMPSTSLQASRKAVMNGGVQHQAVISILLASSTSAHCHARQFMLTR